MSTPVSSTDLSALIIALTQQPSTPQAGLQMHVPNLQPRYSSAATLAADVGALQAAASGLGAANSSTGTGVANTNPGAVALSTSAAPAEDSYYSVAVNSLAQAQVTSSSSTYADADTTIVATGGSLTIGGVAVKVSGSTTLQGLADAINGAGGVPVTAAVVQSAAGQYSLALTGNQTGAAGAFTVANDLTGGAGIAFGANTQEATDASVSIDGVTTTSATNHISSAIPGATLTLLQANASATITLTTAANAPDASNARTLAQNFVTAYNTLEAFAQSQPPAHVNGDLTGGTHDGLLASLMTDLGSQLAGSSGTGDASQQLARVGITLDSSGTLTFDSAAATASPQNLLSGSDSSSGLFSAITTTIDRYVRAGGLVADPQTPAATGQPSLAEQIASMQSQLALEQQLLQQQDAATNSAVSTLTSQGTTLTALSNQFRTAGGA
jgi:flagellar hook-associated protein 2